MIAQSGTVINPLMLYVHAPGGFRLNPDFDTAPTSHASFATQQGIGHKLLAKYDAGLPPAKTYDPTTPDKTAGLTWDRREALRITHTLASGLGDTALYSLAQTAAFRTSDGIHRGLQSSLFGLDLHIRVEEGLAVPAEQIATELTRKNAVKAIDTGRERFIRLPGMNRDAQITGYEFNPGEGMERVFIRDVPACEMFMAATVPDQLRLGGRLIRILPYYMADREAVAQRATELMTKEQGAKIYSVILGPSGDVKNLRTWFGQRPETEILEMLKPLKVDAKGSSLAAEINNKIVAQCAKDYRELPAGLKQAFPSPNSVISENMSLAQRMHLLLDGPYTFFPIFILSRQTAGQAARMLDDIEYYFNSGTDQAGRDVSRIPCFQGEVNYSEGDNTNNCIVIERVPIHTVKNNDGRVSTIYISCVFSRVKKEDEVYVLDLGKRVAESPFEAYGVLKEYMAKNEPFYVTVFGDKS